MKSIILLSFFIITLIYILISLNIFISKKSKEKREKLTPFECGFNFFSFSRMPFSMQFFLIAILFIIFDVEISLMIPLIPTIMKSNLLNWSNTCFFFLFVILLGTLFEWKEKSLEWKK